jgi:hypothetical protein
MIWHFVKRDFKSDRTLWVFLALVIVIGSLSALGNPESYGLAPYFSFLFALTGSNKIVGTQFRSQHQMSRNYILSLPASRERLFWISNVRFLVYATPFLITSLAAPLFNPKLYVEPLRFWVFYFALIAVTVWNFNLLNKIQIRLERRSTFPKSSDRFFAALRLWIPFVIEVVIVVLSMSALLISRLWYFPFALMITFSGATWCYISTRKKWIGV